MPDAPETYPRRVLLAVTGLSPQIVTETVYALTQQQTPPFIPTEVHLVTTAKGAERARLTLLSEEPGWFHRLCRDYRLPAIRFDEKRIHVLRDAKGKQLDDIRTPQDNEMTANFITEQVRRLTADEHCALHVSIAGGRKTMGFYVGYALSLFGRMQDRLSHVLVSPRFEANQNFCFVTPRSYVIYTNLTPRALITALLRRAGLLLEIHADMPGAAGNASSLARHAEKLTDVRDLQWQDWTRYSSRQKQEMTLGGVIGEWRLQGELAPLMPWLWLGQWLHAGKNATMGLGKYRLEWY